MRTPAGAVQIDPTGRAPGRGAYLCREAGCWDAAGRRRALEHALGTAIPPALVATLAAGPGTLPEPSSDPIAGAERAPAPEPLNPVEGGARGQE